MKLNSIAFNAPGDTTSNKPWLILYKINKTNKIWEKFPYGCMEKHYAVVRPFTPIKPFLSFRPYDYMVKYHTAVCPRNKFCSLCELDHTAVWRTCTFSPFSSFAYIPENDFYNSKQHQNFHNSLTYHGKSFPKPFDPLNPKMGINID